jgi:single-strand DNA-binding protein
MHNRIAGWLKICILVPIKILQNMSVNKVILVGNVGIDPEMRYLDGGTAVCRIRLATNETYRKDGEKVTQTEWHNIVIWRGLAEVAEKYVKKGSQLYIEGRIKTRSWDDKEGNKRYTTEIVADNMKMLDRRSDDTSSSSPSQQSEYSSNENQPTSMEEFNPNEGADETDDLPF